MPEHMFCQKKHALKALLTDHDCPQFSVVKLRVLDHGCTSTKEKSNLCSAG